MKETRQTYSLRFTRKEWKIISERAKQVVGVNPQGQPFRGRYLAYLAINEAVIAAGKQETK